MILTSLGLKKPEGTDPVDVQDFNDNADIIDRELRKRPEKEGNASDMTVEFTEAKQLTELSSNDSLKGLFGKLKLAVKKVLSIIELLGIGDISKRGDGTVTGALNELYDTTLNGITLKKISQADYNALAVKDSNTLYIIY